MDDSQLVQLAQAGDQRAFGRLVERHQELLYRACYRLTGQAEDAEELAHEAFVEAFIKLEQLRDPARFAPWVRTIALNLFRMTLRKGIPEPVELYEEITADAGEAEDAWSERLADGLSRLSPPHRLVLALHYLEGLSYEEVATFLDVPIGTVMSRLYRGRQELKRQVERMANEEVPMYPDETFTHEVDAEIAVLLELFPQDKSAAERLSVLLAHAPERLARLIVEAEHEETLTNLAVLLRRLGRPAIEVALASALSAAPLERERATTLLRAFTARLRQGAKGGPALANMPPFEAYLLADALVRSTAPEERKADLLVTLLEASTDEETSSLLASLLVSYPDSALLCLMTRFWRMAEAETLPAEVGSLATLARMGTRFVAMLLEPLSSGDPRRQQLALAGLEAFAKSLHTRRGAPEPLNLRNIYLWAPIPPAHVDQVLVADAEERVARLLDDPRAEIRDHALRVLGLLQAHGCLEHIAGMTGHADSSTRMAALRALANLESPEAVPALRQAAEEGQPAERLAAVEALGRLHAVEAEETLRQRVDDPDRQVRKAAIMALGDIGGEAARATLQQLATSPEKEIARAAVMALHTSPHFRRRMPSYPALEQLEQQVRTRLIGDEAQPGVFISLHDAIGALPEDRPYPERELTRLIAGVCVDYATTRRQLIMDRLMVREHGIYELTETGKAVWRVERFIQEHYLR